MRQSRPRLLMASAALATLVLTGCGTAGSAGEPAPGSAGRTLAAEEFMRLKTAPAKNGMTLLEGPTFDQNGELIVVDVPAPAGEPKVMRVDIEQKTSHSLFTDDRGAYTSAQFSPHDGRLYLTDFAHGEIISLAPGGTDRRTFFTGPVDGARMRPDDIAFDRAGNLYISDSRGLSDGAAIGRVVRIDRTGENATVLAENLAAPNGISFDPEYRGLWVSELIENRISYLHLGEKGGTGPRHTAIRVNGGIAQTDSIAVDAAGNLYQALHGRAAMAVYSPNGERIATVELPDSTEGLESATNVAITPGATTAYLTVSGPAGGYLYTFEALAEGTRQSNGG